jgi:hypothetical protein
MTTQQHTTGKGRAIAYWIVTILLSIAMFLGGIAQLTHAEANVKGMKGLGYPVYLLSLLGTLKIAGTLVLLLPRLPLLKEWAYAGFFFLLTGAIVSHIASGDEFIRWLGPLVFWILVPVSWALRPISRRMAYTVMS